MIKQVIVVRKDLNMRKGKLAAQVAHASMKPFLERARYVSAPSGGSSMAIFLPPEVEEWVTGQFTKVIVSVNSEDELDDIFDKALNTPGLWSAMVRDAGKTEFHGVSTKTAVSILGLSEVVDSITGNLQLL